MRIMKNICVWLSRFHNKSRWFFGPFLGLVPFGNHRLASGYCRISYPKSVYPLLKMSQKALQKICDPSQDWRKNYRTRLRVINLERLWILPEKFPCWKSLLIFAKLNSNFNFNFSLRFELSLALLSNFPVIHPPTQPPTHPTV